MITDFSWGGRYKGQLSPGCEMCIEGRKTVLFVTGHCNADCFYCPVSDQKMHQPHVYVNERFISGTLDIEQILPAVIDEVTISNSRGISLTGGDPLLAPDRCFYIAKALKEEFGSAFHIHLYTPGREGSPQIFKKLSQYIDEIRFHPRNPNDLKQLTNALNYNWSVGIEWPALPSIGESRWFKRILEIYVSVSQQMNRTNMFINLNELEYSEANFERMIFAGLVAKDAKEITSIVPGSREEALRIIETYGKVYPDLSIHYCPAAEKDTQQLPNRLWQRAQSVKLPSDFVFDDSVHRGLLIRGIIRKESFINIDELFFILELEELQKQLIEMFDIPAEMITVDYQKQQLLTSAEFVEECSEDIKEAFPNVVLGIAEEYPTVDRLQTSFIPM